MKYKYFLFDWDGTIGNTLPLWFKRYQDVLSEYGIEMSYKEIGEKMIGNWRGPDEVGIKDKEGFFEKLMVVVPEVRQGNLNTGAFEIIKKIKEAGGKIAVVTTSKRDWVGPAIENSGLTDFIDVFLGKEDAKESKPDPEILLKAIDLLDAEKDSTLMIGDHEKDIEAAKRAGIDSVLYFPERHEIFYDESAWVELGATYTIRDFRELGKFI